MAEPKKRVLVTGANGFTGQGLVRVLAARGWNVLSPAGPVPPPQSGEALFDLLNPESMTAYLRSSKPDAVIHLAAISFAARSDHKPYYETNTVGTINLLQAIEAAQVNLTHFILASSASVYGAQQTPYLHEQLIPQPANDYGISKLAAEHAVRSRKPAPTTVICRPFNYTGPGQHPSFLIAKLVQHFAERAHTIELGNIDVRREFNPVSWICDCYARLIESQRGALTINLCSGEAHSLQSVIDTLTHLTDHTIEVRVNPEFVRANDPPLIAGSLDAMREAGLEPPAKSLENTLKEMLEAY